MIEKQPSAAARVALTRGETHSLGTCGAGIEPATFRCREGARPAEPRRPGLRRLYVRTNRDAHGEKEDLPVTRERRSDSRHLARCPAPAVPGLCGWGDERSGEVLPRVRRDPSPLLQGPGCVIVRDLGGAQCEKRLRGRPTWACTRDRPKDRASSRTHLRHRNKPNGQPKRGDKKQAPRNTRSLQKQRRRKWRKATAHRRELRVLTVGCAAG